MRQIIGFLLFALLAGVVGPAAGADERPVRGIIPRAKGPIVMDGRLNEWRGAFMTPINSGHADWKNRAAVWSYLWDDEALYIGLRTLDEHPFAQQGGFVGNDAVEFYLDTRDGSDLGKPDFGPGTLHMFYTALTGTEIRPQIAIRGGFPAFANIRKEEMKVAATRTPDGLEMEFKLPWKLFPAFHPAAGREIGMDCELSYSDGGGRMDRCWVYSGVQAVSTPSVFGRVRLVDAWDPSETGPYADVLLPAFVMRGNAPLFEPALLTVGISPALQDRVRRAQVTINGKEGPYTQITPYGPGWRRVQSCLVGFTAPTDRSVHVRLLGEGDAVIAERDVPLGR